MIHVSSRTMETSFYADDAFMAKENIRNLKKSMTLDLGGGNNGPGGGGGGIVGIVNGPTAAKRQKFNSLLSSPDLNLLKLASPDLENLIIEQNNGQVTTTPTPSQFLFTKNVTEEQEMYARGFVDALAELHHGTSSMDSVTTTTSNGSSNSGGGNGETNSATNSSTSSYSLSAAIAAAQSTGGVPHHIAHPYSSATTTTTVGVVTGAASQFVTGAAVGNGVVNIKEEPQTVPSGCSSPPLSPIDMMAQERIKLERKRQRNRVAASKCRKRKLERIARLEDKVKLLKDENTELGTVVTKLKDHICHLKQQLMDHVNSGCQIMTPSQYLS